jgi:crotonobetainyl-CoA:carnitine CoA-transferase CaiB-like acyl-CoA transferase
MSPAAPQENAPLQGLRVLDLTSMVLGPYATQILADYGAAVIKVEPPHGDLMRKGGAIKSADMGALYLQLNRNKRSIVLDLKRADARQALLRLCEGADVLVHNNRPAAMRRLELTDDDVRAVNPRLIYVSLIGYAKPARMPASRPTTISFREFARCRRPRPRPVHRSRDMCR